VQYVAIDCVLTVVEGADTHAPENVAVERQFDVQVVSVEVHLKEEAARRGQTITARTEGRAETRRGEARPSGDGRRRQRSRGGSAGEGARGAHRADTCGIE
jgi:hypothetical protein